jgi:hypothetical protein
MLYNSFYFIWLWDVAIRVLYTFSILIDAQNSPGTFDYLKTQTNSLMRDYVVGMAI